MLSYNRLAKSYDALHEQEQLNKLRIIVAEIKTKNFLLDIGCGIGLSRKVFKGKIVGIDPSINLLKKAKGIIGIQAVGENLPFKDNSIDSIISVTSIHNFKSIKKGLKEMKRVCKGMIGISLLRKASKSWEIAEEIRKNFRIIKVVIEARDIIFILKH